jgi:nucleoside-diphosphate-sugar epimerase
MPLRESPVCVVTGGNGYVGGTLTSLIEARNWKVVPWTRQVFRLGQAVNPELLRGVHALVHCAYDFKPRTWQEIEAVNVLGAEKLFEAARQAGVQSIVFISSLSAFEGCRSLYGQAKLKIEEIAQSKGAFVIRPGLVYSHKPGGVFGRLVRQVKNSRVVPTLYGGKQVQYLIHAGDLGNLVMACLNGQTLPSAGPFSIAHEQGWELKQILSAIAAALQKRVIFVPLPWRLVWMGLKTLELAGIPTEFRSDSLLGMIYQNPNPSFAAIKSLNFQCRPFQIASLELA